MENERSVLYHEDLINVRIESNGSPYTGKIIDIDTGKVLNNICGIEYKLDFENGLPKSTLTLTCLPLKLEGHAVVKFTCDACAEKLQIELDKSEAENETILCAD